PRNALPPPTRKSFQFVSENAVGAPGMLVCRPTLYSVMNATGSSKMTPTNSSGGRTSAPLPSRRPARRSGCDNFLPRQLKRRPVRRPGLQVHVGRRDRVRVAELERLDQSLVLDLGWLD